MTVTDCADAQSAPATVVADLGRSAKKFMTKQLYLSLLIVLFGGCATPNSNSDSNGARNLSRWQELKTAPKPNHVIAPVYPFVEARAQNGGLVKVIFTVDGKGRVCDLRVVEATTPSFAESVRSAVLNWQFPETAAGSYKQEFTFTAGGGMGGEIKWQTN